MQPTGTLLAQLTTGGLSRRWHAVLRSSAAVALALIAAIAQAQGPPPRVLETREARQQAVQALRDEARTAREAAHALARSQGWAIRGTTPEGRTFELREIHDGMPVYDMTHNVNAAISTATDRVRSQPLYNGVDGAGLIIGVWDGGAVRATHQEFAPLGRVIVQDGSSNDNHATHVAGTIGAIGADASALGMAPAVTIYSYDWTDDLGEMGGVGASGPGDPAAVYITNHSYGVVSGWATGNWSGNSGRHWFGVWGEPEDRRFGQYQGLTRNWDSLMYSLPYMTVFKSAGNDRNDNPPSTGTTFYYFNGGWQSKPYDPATDPAGDGQKGGYNTIPVRGVAKNLITVGAVNDAVSDGVRSLANATMTAFSGWGPADDGRIKPDIVANGAGLTSPIASNNGAYASYSGTSMSGPNAAGSAVLLVEYFRSLFPGQDMRSSTLKGLIIHTADDLWNPGPDYRFGWGLMNTEAAADHIAAHAADPSLGRIIESTLGPGNSTRQYTFTGSLNTPIRVTLCWTDPPGPTRFALNDPAPVLVNDLDVRVIAPGGGIIYMPYVLDRLNPNLEATTGDNTLDNVEQIYIPNPGLTGEYTVIVSHKGSLTGTTQHFSLLISGHAESDLVFTPEAPFDAAGPAGGPFAPASLTYTIENTANDWREWQVSPGPGVDWLDFEDFGSLLGPGGVRDTEISIAPSAATKAPGTYTGVIIFSDMTDGFAFERPVSLTVRPASAFVWDTIPSPQEAFTPFPVTVTAVDSEGMTVTAFEETVALSGDAGGAVPVIPAVSGAFSGGVWSGNIAVDAGATGMTLRADAGGGAVGDSDPFDVLLPEYTLTTGATNGSILRDPDAVTFLHGEIVTLTPSPDLGYGFAGWAGDVPPGDANTVPLALLMDSDKTITASFDLNEYTLTYLAGANGSLLGSTSQSVAHGSDATPVEAVPDTGYTFAQWTDGVTDNPRTDENITGPISVTAEFQVIFYAVTYSGGTNGSITGNASQSVAHGSDATRVEAVPDVGYTFAQWSDGVTDNPRTDENVTGPISVTAEYTLNEYTVAYLAGANGTITGSTSQSVAHGSDATPVEAVPDTGYTFAQWSDGVTDNPRTDENVTGPISVTAEFQVIFYAVTYSGGANGSITGNASQSVAHGSDATPVEALPDTGYSFAQWSDGVTDNPRTDENVTGPISVTAEYTLNEYSVTYLAGANGSVTGNTSQSVAHGSDATPVEAVPDTGYSFAQWSDGVPDNPRTDENVTGPISVTAEFQVIFYAVTYSGGANGSITGNASQSVAHGSDATPVEALPDTGYSFAQWSDGVTDNPRTDENVTGPISVTAEYTLNEYSVTYLAGANGSVTGNTSQSVAHGSDATPVEAVPDTGYSFAQWSDGVPDNPRTDENVTGPISVTAMFGLEPPPGAPIVTGPDSPTNNPQPIWSWISTGGTGSGYYRLGWEEGSWFATDEVIPAYEPGSPLPDGVHTLFVQERTAAGQWGPSGSFTVLVDTVPPVPTVNGAATGIETLPVVTLVIAFDKPVFGLLPESITVVNGTVMELTGNGTAFTLAVAPATSGTVFVQVPAGAAFDEAGNPSEASPPFTWQYEEPEAPSIPLAPWPIALVMLGVGVWAARRRATPR